MKEIQLTKGYAAIVDDDDYEKVNQYKWYAQTKRYVQYARRVAYKNGGQFTVSMHRFVMDCPDDMQVDHINHNGLDNRKENLRICTNQENSRNMIKRKPTTLGLIKGVVISKCIKSKPYKAHIRYNGKTKDIGYFANVEDAAKAYDKKALEYFGQYAQLNYPLNT